jgi:thiamine pyrophosphate-dependent acetolactate synthase large subunit-like protein
VAQLSAMLRAAGRPLMVLGGGARDAAEPVRALADAGIRVITTVNGKGILDERHPASLGASVRLPAAHALMNQADLLVVVGSELGDSDLWGGTIADGSHGRCVVRIDIDPSQLHKNVAADLAVLADASLALQALVAALWPLLPDVDASAVRALREDRASLQADAARDSGPWAEIQAALVASLPSDTVVAGDSSQVTYYGTVHYWPFTPANRLLYPTGYATRGYGLPAAVGAKVADVDRPVVAVVGDGAAMFSIQELVTAAELGLALPVVVADNGGYAEIREQMVGRGMTPLGVDLARPDFAALAVAMGAEGVVAEDAEHVGALCARAIEAPGPTLIHLRVSS